MYIFSTNEIADILNFNDIWDYRGLDAYSYHGSMIEKKI